MHKRALLGFTIPCALLAGVISNPAFGGAKLAPSTSNVTVNTSARYAYGYYSLARNSTNTTEFLTCNVAQSAGDAPMAWCQFTDLNGVSAMCETYDAGLVATISAVPSDGSIWLDWNASGTCTYVQTTVSSEFGPKAP
jgi:hypothetical protein